MDENPFVKQDARWQPPNKGAPNPYRQAKIVKQVVEVRSSFPDCRFRAD